MGCAGSGPYHNEIEQEEIVVPPENDWVRVHRIPDFLLLLSVVCLALATWAGLSRAAAVPLWRPYFVVSVTIFFALAALTRHPYWAVSMRAAMGAWIIAAPWMLGFTGPPLWTWLAVGGLVAPLSFRAMTRPRTPFGTVQAARSQEVSRFTKGGSAAACVQLPDPA